MWRVLMAVFAVSAIGMGTIPWAAFQEKPVAPPSEDLKELVRGNNEFAFDLYAQLRKKEGNLVFSPYSISSALAMTYAGAKGKTAEEMAKALRFHLPEGKLHANFAALSLRLQTREKKDSPKLVISNCLWGQEGIAFDADFLQLLTAAQRRSTFLDG